MSNNIMADYKLLRGSNETMEEVFQTDNHTRIVSLYFASKIIFNKNVDQGIYLNWTGIIKTANYRTAI